MTSKEWQLATDAAVRYQEILVPAILGAFAEALVDYANLDHVDVLVDMGCGTGAATRYAAQKMSPSTTVIGIDRNAGMLKVAQSLPEIDGATIEWKQDNAYDLSLEDNSVDAVICAQTLQFMDKRHQALSEMHRILKAGQSVYISLWSPIEESPYFDALVNTVATHINPDTAAGLGSAFNLSDIDEIKSLLQDAQFTEISSDIAELHLELPPIHEFVPRHISATPMGAGYQAASESAQQAILADMQSALSAYQTESGIRVPFCSHLIKGIA